MKIFDTDSPADIAYKNLLSNQLSWCISNRDVILKQAEKLYRLIVSKKAWDHLIDRCCDFTLDETLCESYKTEKYLTQN